MKNVLMIPNKVEKAVQDLRYLLNRGYPRDSAVEYVSDHYLLESDDRHLLARCIFSNEEVSDHKKRKIDLSGIDGRRVAVDGYNVLITVESILEGERVVKCDDYFVRDLKAIFGKYKMTESTDRAIEIIIEKLARRRPSEVDFLFDKQVSKSGELAGYTRRKMKEIGLSGNAQTTVGTDLKVWEHEVSASSDRVIIEKSEMVLDLPSEFLEEEMENLIDLTEI